MKFESCHEPQRCFFFNAPDFNKRKIKLRHIHDYLTFPQGLFFFSAQFDLKYLSFWPNLCWLFKNVGSWAAVSQRGGRFIHCFHEKQRKVIELFH